MGKNKWSSHIKNFAIENNEVENYVLEGNDSYKIRK